MENFMKNIKLLALVAVAVLSMNCWAQEASAIGLWRNIDDQTGKAKALIRISEEGGEYIGKIEKLFLEPNQPSNPVCEKCEDARKSQSIVGMSIITGMKRRGDELAGGFILDPNNGKIYKSQISVVDGGKRLNVRGYIGIPMLGRTQVWLREE